MPFDYLAFVHVVCRFFLFLLLFVAAILDKLPALSSSDDILPNKKFKIPSPPPGCIVREEVIKRDMFAKF